MVDPVVVDDGEIVVDCAGEGNGHCWQPLCLVCFCIKHLQSMTTVSTTNSTLIVRSLQPMLFSAKGTLENQEWAIDCMAWRDVPSAKINTRACADQVAG